MSCICLCYIVYANRSINDNLCSIDVASVENITEDIDVSVGLKKFSGDSAARGKIWKG